MAKRTPEQNRAIYARRKARAQAEGTTVYYKRPDYDPGNPMWPGATRGQISYGKRRSTVIRRARAGNRLACGQGLPPDPPRNGSLMCDELNNRVNPRHGGREGDWRWRLWHVVDDLRAERRAERLGTAA